MPVMPGRSLALPTCATHPPAMVGSSCRSTSSTRMPLGKVFSMTGTFCAHAPGRSARPIKPQAAASAPRWRAGQPARTRKDFDIFTRLELQQRHCPSTAKAGDATAALLLAGLRIGGNRPHPGPLPQERGNRAPLSG